MRYVFAGVLRALAYILLCSFIYAVVHNRLLFVPLGIIANGFAIGIGLTLANYLEGIKP